LTLRYVELELRYVYRRDPCFHSGPGKGDLVVTTSEDADTLPSDIAQVSQLPVAENKTPAPWGNASTGLVNQRLSPSFPPPRPIAFD